jgi:hypothetical protein
MTLIFNGTDNSVSNPAIQGGTGGTTTGVYYPSANAIAISTGGVNALTISNTQAATFASNVSFSSQLSVPAAGIKFSDSTTITSNAPPNVTVYTSGSGTYTTPTGAKWLFIRMVAGGGGGTGGGSSGVGGGTGGNTTFGASLSCLGGQNFSPRAATGGDLNLTGGWGQYPDPYIQEGTGQQGGNSPFGGAGGGVAYQNSGASASANTGSGGAGGSSPAGNPSYTGVSGASGAYLEKTIASPASTYSYAVGAGGTGGAAGGGGGAGGSGGSGVIIVTAYF